MLRLAAALALLMPMAARANGPVQLIAPIPGPALDAGADPLALTPAMRAWVHAEVGSGGSSDDRMRRLLRALDGLGIAYRPDRTTSAAGVFATREANCLSFTHLVVALGREIGVDAVYLRVDDTRTWAADEALVVVSGHVSPGYGPAALGKRVDLGMGPISGDLAHERIPDRQAAALHRTNLGAERLIARDPHGALRELRAATELAPELPETWVGLGVALLRTGEPDRAEAAWLKALELDPDRISAWTDLAALYRLRGDVEGARQALLKADRVRNRNPRTFQALAQLAEAASDPSRARHYRRRAQRLERQLPHPDTGSQARRR